MEITFYDDSLYWRELMYERNLTNQDLVTKLKTIPELRGQLIIADCAEPDKIEDLKRAKFNAQPAFKNVKETIDFVKSKRLFIHPLSENIKREIKKYSWKTDKTTGNLLDEVVKFDDHAMDAGRYGSYHFHKGKAKFFSQ